MENLQLDENTMGHLPIGWPMTAVNNLLTGNRWSKRNHGSIMELNGVRKGTSIVVDFYS